MMLKSRDIPTWLKIFKYSFKQICALAWHLKWIHSKLQYSPLVLYFFKKTYKISWRSIKEIISYFTTQCPSFTSAVRSMLGYWCSNLKKFLCPIDQQTCLPVPSPRETSGYMHASPRSGHDRGIIARHTKNNT